jgi:toxin-antitoxin system PIN domain toxin
MPKSTRPFLFPDINVWVALTYEGHVHHIRARDWYALAGVSARFYFCRFTQLGLLRLLTAEAVMGREVLTQAGAWRAYDRWLNDQRVAFMEEPQGLEAPFRALTRSAQAAPKDWADSYLAAFAAVSQLTVVTFDRGFEGKARQLVLLKG